MPKAVQFDSYGALPFSMCATVPRPVPGAGEALVEVRAVGINPSEAVIRSGALHTPLSRDVSVRSGQRFGTRLAELGPASAVSLSATR